MLRDLLSQWGYEVITADSGDQAWESFAREDFSIVISSWVLKGIDGLELVRRVRSHESGDHVYAILLTSRSAKENILQGMEAGADAFIAKPCDPEELRVRLRAADRLVRRHKRSNDSSITRGLVLGGSYQLGRRLAVGGMAEVYLATEVRSNRLVVVKLIEDSGSADSAAGVRFEQEAEVLRSFDDPSIVSVFDSGRHRLGEARVALWMAMEYMPGGDVASRLAHDGRPPLPVALRWLRQSLSALRCAHERAIVHRDVKPHNLLLDGQGEVKLGDFGLLKQFGAKSAELTSVGQVMGTPAYMAPEQAEGLVADQRADLFSLGVTFFHVLSGKLAFDGPNATAILLRIIRGEASDLTEAAPDLPRPVSVLIHRMMAHRPEERYQEAGVALEDLNSYQRQGILSFDDAGSGTWKKVERADGLDAATGAYVTPSDDSTVL